MRSHSSSDGICGRTQCPQQRSKGSHGPEQVTRDRATPGSLQLLRVVLGIARLQVGLRLCSLQFSVKLHGVWIGWGAMGYRDGAPELGSSGETDGCLNQGGGTDSHAFLRVFSQWEESYPGKELSKHLQLSMGSSLTHAAYWSRTGSDARIEHWAPRQLTTSGTSTSLSLSRCITACL